MDLEQTLEEGHKTFDVVFNHTTLEHIFNVQQAFANICSLSKDIVIIVVPFLQEEHTDYGDYWRFTPQAVERLFAANGLQMIFVSYNDDPGISVYVFAIASRSPEKWEMIRNAQGNLLPRLHDPSRKAGRNILPNRSPRKLLKHAVAKLARLPRAAARRSGF